jgi:DeoR/GlpR family transcriptional regulator of sugar metabolism
LTVATNAIDIAAAVLRRGDVPLIVVGGAVEPDVGGCVDASAVQAVSAMAIDRCFLGACAVSAATGVGATHHADAHFKRALMAASHAVVVLATTEKLHAKAPHKVTALAGVSLLVLEADAPPEAVSALHRAGATVHLAAPATAEPHRAGGAA